MNIICNFSFIIYHTNALIAQILMIIKVNLVMFVAVGMRVD